MRNIVFALMAMFVSLVTLAQEPRPNNAIPVNGQFYMTLPDSAIWQFKGTPYGWSRVAKYKDVESISPTGFAAIVTDTSTYLYKRNNWTDFNDFVAQGSYTLANGKIHVTPGQSDILSVNRPTGLQKNKLSYTYRATNGLSNSAGIRFGYVTVNNTAATGFQFWFDESTRKINMYDVASNTSFTATPVLASYTPGDQINISYQNVGYNGGTITVANLTTGASISYVKQNKYVNPSAPSGSSNSSNISVLPQNTTVAYDIVSIEYSTPYKPGGNLFVGDSIDVGSASTVLPGGYAYQLNGQIDAGQGDKSREVILRLPEIIALKPGTVWLKIGTNDFDVPSWQANIVTIVTALRAAGIRVITLTPPPMNSTNKQAYRDSLFKMYPNTSIDLFTPLKASSGTGYDPTWDSGDGVHPNQLGHNVIAETIVASPLWSTAVYNKTLDTAIVVKKLTNTAVIPGWYGVTPFKVRSDGRIESVKSLTGVANLGVMYNNNGVPGVTSNLTYNTANNRLISSGNMQAAIYYGGSVYNATSQGNNSLDFYTQSLANRVARMFNTGHVVFGAGAAIDGGFGLQVLADGMQVAGTVAATSFSAPSHTANGSTPAYLFSQQNGTQPANTRNYQIVVRSGVMSFELLDDSFLNATPFMTVNRMGVLPTRITIPNGTLITNQNLSLRDTSYKAGTFQAYVSPANYTAGARPGFGFNSDTNYGGFLYMNGYNDFKIRQDNGTTFNIATNPMTAANDLVVGGTTGIPARLGIGSNGQVLTVASGAPTWATPAAGFTNPMTTQNDIIYAGSGGTPTRLGVGSTGQVLTSNGSSIAPSWQTLSSGGGTQRLSSWYTTLTSPTTTGNAYSLNISANTIVSDGSFLETDYFGAFTGGGGTCSFDLVFAGTSIFSSGTLNSGGNVSVHFRLIKTSSSTARYSVEMSVGSGTTINTKASQGDLSGLDFTSSNISKITFVSDVAGALVFNNGIVKYTP